MLILAPVAGEGPQPPCAVSLPAAGGLATRFPYKHHWAAVGCLGPSTVPLSPKQGEICPSCLQGLA